MGGAGWTEVGRTDVWFCVFDLCALAFHGILSDLSYLFDWVFKRKPKGGEANELEGKGIETLLHPEAEVHLAAHSCL